MIDFLSLLFYNYEILHLSIFKKSVKLSSF